MKREGFLCIIFLAIGLLTSATLFASTESEQPSNTTESSQVTYYEDGIDVTNKTKFNPESEAWIYAFAGYGYYDWKMMNTNDFTKLFTKQTIGLDYTHNAEPFIVKKYGIRANVLLLSVGFDYLGNKWPSFDKSDEDKFRNTGNNHLQQLRYFSGLSFGSYIFVFDYLSRDFKSTITSRGMSTFSNTNVPFYYYPEKDSPYLLANGDKISWNALDSEYEVRVDKKFTLSIMSFGLRYVTYDAPTQLHLTTIGSSGNDLLMYTKNEFYYLFFNFKHLNHIAGDFYYSLSLPISISGVYASKNRYFDTGLNPYSHGTSYALASAGSLSLQYLLSHLKIETGFDYSFNTSYLMKTEIRTKNDLTYTDQSGGSALIPAGSQVSLTGQRIEIFWGMYVHVVAFF